MFKRAIESLKHKIEVFSGYFLILVSLVLILSLARNILKIRKADKRIEEAGEKVEGLRLESEKLKEEVESLKSEEYREKQLRDKLGLAKEGEITLVLPEKSILGKLAPRFPEEEEALPDPNWKKWYKLFF